jgi:hypothetical protein
VGAASFSLHFEDTGRHAGIDAVLSGGSPEKRWIMEANGGGVAVLDYDNDGRMDLLLVNAASVAMLQRLVRSETPEARKDGVFLYRNEGNGTFRNVTKAAGLANPFWGTGANAADYDGDGFTDILLTNIGQDVLFRNRRDGTFEDVSRSAGLRRTLAWHTGSAFLDYDGDGDLDLYIAGYINVAKLGIDGSPPVCRYLEMPVFCGPVNLTGEPDVFYRNEGGGLFREATAAAGLLEREPRFGFTVVAEDFNGDRRPDLFVANDSGANYLYLNNGRGEFAESALTSGVAYNADGKAQANMGVAVGDYDNDGDVDLLTTTFSEDYFPLFQQTSPGIYEDVSSAAGLVRATAPLLGWACGFADLDNDGWRDLWLANGHVYPAIGQAGRTTYDQPVLVMQNRRGRFAPGSYPVVTRARASWRGGAAGDFDNDGKIDLIVSPVEGQPALLENRSSNRNQWIGFDLRGHAPGAAIHIEACGMKQVDTVRSGGSYLSASDPRRHFGLGSCNVVDRVTVEWPSGRKQILKSPAAGRYHIVQ